MMPTLAAPGRHIPVADGANGFTTVEGTSFAAPFVAGALALWLQAHRDRTPAVRIAHHLLAGTTSKAPANAYLSKAGAPTGTVMVGDTSSLRLGTAKPAAASPSVNGPAQRKPLQAAGTIKASRSGASTPAAVGPAQSGAAATLPTLQEAAYSAFVSTAAPVYWRTMRGWAQPLARVGAGV